MVAPKSPANMKGRAIATKSDQLQSSDATTKQADEFEAEMSELKVKYDQYFLGLERFEPIKEREDFKARLVKFKSTFIRNTGVRFRVQAQFQKFLSLERMWLRIAGEIENGTYTRDLFKARLRGAKRNKKTDDRQKGEAFDLSAEEHEPAPAPTSEPKTDPHLVIPAELRAPRPPAPPLDDSDDPPLIMPAPVRSAPPPPPKDSSAVTDALPALVMPRPVGARPPPPPPGSTATPPPPPPATGRAPPPPPPGSMSSPAARVSGAMPAVVPAVARPSGSQPAIRPAGSASSGSQTAVTSTTGARAVSNPGARPPPPPPSDAGGPARPPPPPPSATGSRPAVMPPQRPSSPSNSAIGEDKIKAIYSAYVAAKRQCKESTDGLTYESVAKTINTQVPELMKAHNAKTVDFKVVIKNGKATLKAVPKT